MEHNMIISISKGYQDTEVATVRQQKIRERILKYLLGNASQVTVIVPGSSVKEIAIESVKEKKSG